MTDTSTLQSTQPKRETVRQKDFLGGTFENIENVFDTITGLNTGYVNEGPVTKEEFQDLQKAPEHQFGMPSTGSIEFNSKPQALAQEIAKILSEKSREETLKARRAEVNEKIGIGNTSYEDTVDENFTLRTDVQTDWERINSELNTEQLKAKREVVVGQARGIKRIVGADMNRDFEDRNMGSPG